MLQASEMRNANLLVVDEREASSNSLLPFLQQAGYQHISYRQRARVACPLHLAHPFDLIILSLDMPGAMEALQDLQENAAESADPYLPILVISADLRQIQAALQNGAQDFLSLPLQQLQVQVRVEQLLQTHALRKKLASAQQDLEHTVQQRTAELQKNAASFKSFTELSSDWYWEQDLEGKFTRVSGPVLEMLGIDDENADNAAELAREKSAEFAQLHEHIATRRPFLDFVYGRRHTDGSVQYLQVSGEPMFDEASCFVGYRGVGLEITERRRSDQLQQRFRSALDASDVGILLIEASSLRLIDVSSAICRISGYSREELYALPLAKLGVGSDAQLAERFANGNSKQSCALETSDGRQITVTIDWQTVKVLENNLLLGIVKIAPAAA